MKNHNETFDFLFKKIFAPNQSDKLALFQDQWRDLYEGNNTYPGDKVIQGKTSHVKYTSFKYCSLVSFHNRNEVWVLSEAEEEFNEKEIIIKLTVTEILTRPNIVLCFIFSQLHHRYKFNTSCILKSPRFIDFPRKTIDYNSPRLCKLLKLIQTNTMMTDMIILCRERNSSAIDKVIFKNEQDKTLFELLLSQH